MPTSEVSDSTGPVRLVGRDFVVWTRSAAAGVPGPAEPPARCSMLRRQSLLRLDAGRPDDLRPLRDLGPDLGGEFVGPVPDWLVAEVRQAFFHGGLRENADDLPVEERDELLVGAGRGEDPDPR